MSVSQILAQKRLREYRKVFADSGWNISASGRAVADQLENLDGPVLYLCDVETGQLFVCATVKNAFSLVEQRKQKKGIAFDSICDAFGSLFTDLCTGKVKLDHDTSDLLAMAATMYVTGTQGYRIAREQGMLDAHYLIFRHLDHSTNQSLLRPVPISARRFYEPEAIEHLVDTVLDIDRRNHPERFKSAQIIPFKIKSRTEL